MTLPTDYSERKALPLWDFMFGYFVDAWLAVVSVAVAGDKQHKNEGKTIHWAREKSTDQLNTAFRHQFDYGMGVKKDTDGEWHLAKAIWRLSAQLQLDIEAERGRPTMAETTQADQAERRKRSVYNAIAYQRPEWVGPQPAAESVNAAIDRLAIASESPEESLAARSPAPLIRPLFGHRLD